MAHTIARVLCLLVLALCLPRPLVGTNSDGITPCDPCSLAGTPTFENMVATARQNGPRTGRFNNECVKKICDQMIAHDPQLMTEENVQVRRGREPLVVGTAGTTPVPLPNTPPPPTHPCNLPTPITTRH